MNGVYSGGIFGLSGNCFHSSPIVPVGHQPFTELRQGIRLDRRDRKCQLELLPRETDDQSEPGSRSKNLR
jgi:hypothetical protein